MLDLRVLRDIANVLNGSTPLGLLTGVLAGGRFRFRNGLIIVDRARVPAMITASAVTIGNVVLVPRGSLEDAVARIPRLLEHEDEHAWQYAYCLGLPFLPLYLAATVWSLVRTHDRARANFFEVQAGLETGGYRGFSAGAERSGRLGADCAGGGVASPAAACGRGPRDGRAAR